jgi:hypothetical protein
MPDTLLIVEELIVKDAPLLLDAVRSLPRTEQVA